MELNRVIDLIREAQRSKTIVLNLSDENLTSLPPEIGELKNLTVLDISDNRLTSLPPEIGELKNLTKLDISYNRLTLLLPEIGELKNLTELDIRSNQLTSLPPEIGELKNLTELYISSNQLTSLPIEIVELKNLTVLYITNNQLTSLPPEIGELKNLTELETCSNQLTSLPPEIGELKNLTKLYIYYNQLTSLPPEIGELKNLIDLNICNNQLTSLPPEIGELKNLTVLYICDNQLTSLPPEIGELKNLTVLYIPDNQLTSVPPEIVELKNLTKLDISDNRLTSLPPEIVELKNLTKLGISGNRLTSLPPEIGELKNLINFSIRKNRLTSLPLEILELDMAIKWAILPGDEGILLEGNPLEIPPIEIVKQGKKAVLNYFKSLDGERKPLNEVKVLLVGDGGAGKTSLVKRILGEGFDGNEHKTQGINIKEWVFEDKDKDMKVNFWDFGGQEIMHATHQFFLSKRSLYILVLDSRKDEKAEYWLKHIMSFGGDSPILVVLNKIDENPSFELNRKFLQEKYPSIKGFFRISCKENNGVGALSKKLQKEISKIEHLQIEWAKSWFNVKTRLEKMNCNFITYEEYRSMCLEENVDDKSSQNTLVDFLNDLGVIVHFKDFSLLDTHVLEPRWITEGVYKIINSETLAKKKGVLPFSMLDEILEQKKEDDYYYPVPRYNFIINLMKKFELCYAIDDETVLLPDLLAVPEPSFNFDLKGALKFFIEYDFLPRSIMPRFIVKMNRDIKDNLHWRTGVVLEDKGFNSIAVIRADNEAKRISIFVNGKQKRDYFAILLQRFREINSSFEKLKAIEKISLPNEPEVTVSYEHLIKLELRGIEMYIPDGSDYEYKVSELLGTVINWNSERVLLEKILLISETNRSNEIEILEILRTLQEIETVSDTEETLLEKLTDAISVNLRPLPVSVNLGKILKLYRQESKKRRTNLNRL